MESQILLKQGAVRRIGNGHSTSILKDPWLPHTCNPFVQTVHPALEEKAVTALMLPEQNTWDIDLIKDIFSDRDAQLIQSIPINSTDEDSWYWRYDKMSEYSVKSAYHAIQESKGDNNNNSNNSGFWRSIWNLKIPKKIHIFIWRAVRDCLLTKEQLILRKVAVDPRCPVCNIESETTFHSIVTCLLAIKCWEFKGYSSGYNSGNLTQWIEERQQTCKKEEMETICVIAWYLWKHRNDIVWNQRGMEACEVVKSAENVLSQWKSAQDKTFDNYLGYMTQADGKMHWEKPPEGKIKVNTDGAIFEASGTYSFSMVARDHAGDLIVAKTSCRQGNITPEMAEAMGIREELSWLKKDDSKGAMVETDCLAVVQAIRSSTQTRSYLGRIISECKHLLDILKERNVTLSFVKRSANQVAHFLVRNSSSVAERRWRAEEAHPLLIDVMLEDLKN